MLTEARCQDLAKEVAGLASLPRLDTVKRRWRPRRHVRMLRLGDPPTDVVLKAYCKDKRGWESSCLAEYQVLSLLRGCLPGESALRVPEPLCLRDQQQVVAMTRLPGRPMPYLVYLYGITRLGTKRLLHWSRRLGQGLAEFQLACRHLNGEKLRRREISEEQVRIKTPHVPLLVEAGLDCLVRERSDLLLESPQCLAHCDLSLQNILVDRDRFGLLDWEYADAALKWWRSQLEDLRCAC